MGITNFSKRFFSQKTESISSFIDSQINNGKFLGIFLDANLIKMHYGGDLGVVVDRLTQILCNYKDDRHHIFVVNESSTARSYSKLSQSIHRKPCTNPYLKYDTYNPDHYRQLSVDAVISEQKRFFEFDHCVSNCTASIDGDQTIVFLVNWWLKGNCSNFALILSTDQDFLFYYLTNERVTNAYFDDTVKNLFIKEKTVGTKNELLKIKLNTLLDAHDYNLYMIKLDAEYFVNNYLVTKFESEIKSDYKSKCQDFDYLLEMTNYLIYVLEVARIQPALFNDLIGNSLRYCTFLVNNKNDVCGIIEKCKKPSKDKKLITVNEVFDYDKHLGTRVFCWPNFVKLNTSTPQQANCLSQIEEYCTILKALKNSFLTMRNSVNNDKTIVKLAIDISKINFDVMTDKARIASFFGCIEYFFTILSKMNTFLMHSELTDDNPFSNDVIGSTFYKKCCQIIKLLIILFKVDSNKHSAFCDDWTDKSDVRDDELSLLNELDYHYFVEFLTNSDIWILRKFVCTCNVI